MALPVGSYTAHVGTLYDAQYDYYSQRLATASSDGVVRIWSADQRKMLAELPHQAAVLHVAWAPGKCPAVQLATGAADGRVAIWRQEAFDQWSMLHSLTVTGPTAAIAFCPAEYGLILAAAGSEGRDIWFFTGKDGGRDCRGITETLAAAPGGLVALSWAPAASPSTLAAGPAAKSASKAPRRLVSAAARSVRIWRHEETWSMREELIQGPGPAVRDVAWRPNLGIPSSSVAMCFEDGLVQIWSQDMEGQAWNMQVSWSVNDEAWRLAWSKAGCMLAVSYGMNSCQLFKEGLVSEWKEVCNLDGE